MANPNHREVEAKIIEVSLQDLEARLQELWAQKIFEWELDATWLMNRYSKEVRVRREWDTIQVEYKEIVTSEDWVKEAIEIGFQSNNLENTLLVFEKLWFTITSTSVKTRISYLLKENERLDFDTYSRLWGLTNLPELLEIEASSKEVIIKIAELLGYTEADLKDWTPRELIEHYSQ